MADQASTNGQEPRLADIPVSKIRENEVALRKVKKQTEDYLMMLDSVKKRGILVPIIVREVKDTATNEVFYGLIDGLQRWNCAVDAGLKVIPARIMDMNQAEIEEAQIVANAKKIETKPVEYAKQITRLFERNPTLTVTEMAAKLSASTAWVYKMLGLARNLNKDIHPHGDDGRISLSNLCELSKLPEEEQATWVDKAMTMTAGEFTAAVAGRVKQIKEARKKGQKEGPAEFQAVPHQRKWAEIKAEFENHAFRDSMIKRHNVKTPAEAWDLAISWVAQMDPDSKIQQKADHDAREAEAAAKADEKRLERTRAREAEAAKTRAELEARMKERGAAPTPATV